MHFCSTTNSCCCTNLYLSSTASIIFSGINVIQLCQTFNTFRSQFGLCKPLLRYGKRQIKPKFKQSDVENARKQGLWCVFNLINLKNGRLKVLFHVIIFFIYLLLLFLQRVIKGTKNITFKIHSYIKLAPTFQVTAADVSSCAP